MLKISAKKSKMSNTQNLFILLTNDTRYGKLIIIYIWHIMYYYNIFYCQFYLTRLVGLLQCCVSASTINHHHYHHAAPIRKCRNCIKLQPIKVQAICDFSFKITKGKSNLILISIKFVVVLLASNVLVALVSSRGKFSPTQLTGLSWT